MKHIKIIALVLITACGTEESEPLPSVTICELPFVQPGGPKQTSIITSNDYEAVEYRVTSEDWYHCSETFTETDHYYSYALCSDDEQVWSHENDVNDYLEQGFTKCIERAVK